MNIELEIDTELQRLTALEQAVLKDRFGLPLGAAHAIRGKRLRLSPGRIEGIERRALRKLRGMDIGDSLESAGLRSVAPPDELEAESRELLNMAVFKLQDCAQRMLTLAQAASSPELGTQLLSVYHQLMQEQGRLQQAALSAAGVKTPAVGAAA